MANAEITNLIAAAFTTDTYSPNVLDVQQTPVYDQFTVAAAQTLTTANASFFTNVGGNSGKTIVQTNLSQPKRLAAPQNFSIQALRLKWSENVFLPDALAIVNGTVYEFVIGEKWYHRAPIWMLAAAGGVTGAQLATSAATAAPFSVVNNGVPTRESLCRLNIPIVIGNQTDFQAGLVTQGAGILLTAGGSGGTGFTCTNVLDGYYARGVQ